MWFKWWRSKWYSSCAFDVTSANLHDPEDYPITVTGNSPSPYDFPGSSTGTPVTIGAGAYDVTGELASTAAIQQELGATSVITTTTAAGDCTPNFGPNINFLSDADTMASGGSQEYTLINPVIINGREVPDARTG